jgi:hypothetical protein
VITKQLSDHSIEQSIAILQEYKHSLTFYQPVYRGSKLVFVWIWLVKPFGSGSIQTYLNFVPTFYTKKAFRKKGVWNLSVNVKVNMYVFQCIRNTWLHWKDCVNFFRLGSGTGPPDPYAFRFTLVQLAYVHRIQPLFLIYYCCDITGKVRAPNVVRKCQTCIVLIYSKHFRWKCILKTAKWRSLAVFIEMWSS